jgi:hypothetical protein
MMKYPNETDVLKANLAIATGFLAIYLFTKQQYSWMLYVAVTIGAVALLIPALSRWVAWVWFKLAEGLGWFNSRVILSLVFFIFLFPFAFLFRLFNKTGNWFKAGKTAKSVYQERNHLYSAKDLEDSW